MYRARLEKTKATRDTLLERAHQDVRIIDEYERFIEMIELELEGGGTDDEPANDGAEAGLVRLDELQRLKAASAELRIQVEARDEVEQILEK